jgi:hypothetical protein
MPAGLPNAVEASFAAAARPAAATPKSGVPISYRPAPPAHAGVAIHTINAMRNA